MLETLVMEGTMHRGNTFTVTEIKEGDEYIVQLTSPKGNVIDAATLRPDEIGPWLLHRIDW